jgi:polysaccharide biosynthesis/export protein
MRLLMLSVFSLVFFVSCRTQKNLIENNYLQNLNDSMTATFTIKEAVIQKNDLLQIQVYSSATEPGIDQPYNLRQAEGAPVQGFLVDVNGNIEYPRLGLIKAEGLSKLELAEVIRAKLRGQLENPSVIIRFLNYRVTVLGEVQNPGVVTVPTERLTILEALGMAGDVTEFGKRSRVKVLRESQGKQQIGIVDLTDPAFFQSPYYQLQQNDVVMVDQGTERVRRDEEQRRAQQIGIATSVVTTIVLLLTLFR